MSVYTCTPLTLPGQRQLKLQVECPAFSSQESKIAYMTFDASRPSCQLVEIYRASIKCSKFKLTVYEKWKDAMIKQTTSPTLKMAAVKFSKTLLNFCHTILRHMILECHVSHGVKRVSRPLTHTHKYMKKLKYRYADRYMYS